MKITLPFRKINEWDIPRPWLQITVINPLSGQKLNILGLIDTGADECALPAGLAALLGHNLAKGTRKEIMTGGGVVVAYSHTLRIQMEDFTTQEVLIDFLPKLKIPLLGVTNFLCNFILTVDYKKEEFSLEE